MQQSTKMEGTVFTPALEGIKHVKSEQGEILSQPFLDVCKHILPIIGTCSTSLTLLLKQDKVHERQTWFLDIFFQCVCCVLFCEGYIKW